jgi:hypothetical protein
MVGTNMLEKLNCCIEIRANGISGSVAHKKESAGADDWEPDEFHLL